jgi:hypothetical protein
MTDKGMEFNMVELHQSTEDQLLAIGSSTLLVATCCCHSHCCCCCSWFSLSDDMSTYDDGSGGDAPMEYAAY